MTVLLAYLIIAILLVILVWALLRAGSGDRTVSDADEQLVRGIWDEQGLALAERIFDSTDYHWLQEALGFPHMALFLARCRQQMALKWLRALRRSFDELVRTPELEPAGNVSGAPESWQLLWLTLRFHSLLSYAVLVVWLLGPYHRLVPSFGWMHVFSEPAHQKERYGAGDMSNFS